MDFLSQLNSEQADAAGTVNGPVLVLAGAGTGKTRVITYRIAHMLSIGIMPEQILGMTFTNKAAREMKERLAQLVDPKVANRVTLGTFHSFCIRVLRREAIKLGYLPGFTIADDSDQQGLLKQAAGHVVGFERTPLPEIHAMIGRWKNKLLGPNDAKIAANNGFEEAAALVYERYQELLELQNMLDFDDMLLLVHRLFTEFPEVLERYRERYHYLLIDEYQDTNAAQFTLVKMLVGERYNLCVVGDDDQSIYSWRGADVENILNFPDHFPGAKVVKLEQNYRSTSRILHAANAVIGSNPNRHQKKLWSNLGEGEEIEIVKTGGGEAEADFIAGMISQMANDPDQSYDYKDFAILYRSNYLSRELEQGLRKLQLPYRLVGGQEFYKRREIKDAVAYLKLLVNPREDQSLLRILGTPPRGLAGKTVEALKISRASGQHSMLELLGSEEFRKKLSAKAAEPARKLAEVYHHFREEFKTPGNLAGKISRFLREVGYLDGLQQIYKDLNDAMKRRENVDEFINAIAQYEGRQPEGVTLLQYLEDFALLEESDRTEEKESDGNSVTLSTVHASKGLEFPVVFLVALERDIFPHERAVAEGSLDEELRLFYVAITRARRKLFISRATQRLRRGFLQPSSPSMFLNLLCDEVECEKRPEELLKEADSDRVKQAFADIFKMLE